MCTATSSKAKPAAVAGKRKGGAGPARRVQGARAAKKPRRAAEDPIPELHVEEYVYCIMQLL